MWEDIHVYELYRIVGVDVSLHCGLGCDRASVGSCIRRVPGQNGRETANDSGNSHDTSAAESNLWRFIYFSIYTETNCWLKLLGFFLIGKKIFL